MNRIDGAASKRFSNAVLTWEIERFPLILTQKLIRSPKITVHGPVETAWRMHLDMSNKPNILLKLEMVPNNTEIKRVQVHWAYCIPDENEIESYTPERYNIFVPTTKLLFGILSISDTLKMLGQKTHDTLILRLRILINFEINLPFPHSRIAGIMELSNDLVGLPKSFLYHDIITKVGNEEFSLHRAMLYQYGARMKKLLEQSASHVRVDFSLSEETAAAAIFSYLYTGDLKYILSRPTIAISNYIDHLEIPNLNNVYSLQRIKASSSVELIEQTFNWTVSDFKTGTKKLEGPELKIIGMESRIQLFLDIGEPTDEESTKSLVVEAKLTETEKMLTVCLQFFCGKTENEMLSSPRFYRVMIVGERVSARFIENDCFKMEENDTLVVKVKAHIRTGDIFGAVVENEPTTAVINYERSFMNLSKMLRNLKESNTYSDFHFEIEDQHIKSHKFFVAARSPLMKELFRRHEGVVSVKVYGCKKDVFDNFLSYMYTGILTETDAYKLIELYKLGVQYSVYGLKNVVTGLLTKLVNTENMLNVLIFADDIEDDKLKNAAIDHVLKNADKLEEHRDYAKFKGKKSRVHLQIQQLIAKQPS